MIRNAIRPRPARVSFPSAMDTSGFAARNSGVSLTIAVSGAATCRYCRNVDAIHSLIEHPAMLWIVPEFHDVEMAIVGF